MNDVLISIIVPVYNVEKYLEKCLISLINQTYSNIEIILVDDGSTDKSGKICDEYATKDNRIIVIHKSNAGVSAARNDGLDIIKGEFVTFVDSDDYVDDDYIEKLYCLITDAKADMSICGFCNVENNKIIDDKRNNIKLFDNATAMIALSKRQITFGILSKLYKVSLIKNIRFDSKYRVGEDHLFNYYAIKKAKKININETYKLYKYVSRNDSVTNLKKYNSATKDGLDVWIDIINDQKENKKNIRILKKNYFITTFRVIKNFIITDFNNNEEFENLKKYLNIYHIPISVIINPKQFIFYILVKQNCKKILKIFVK